MESLSRPCQNCHKPMNGGVYRASHICPHCLCEHEGGSSRARRKQRKHTVAPQAVSQPIAAKLHETAAQRRESPSPAPAGTNSVALSSRSAGEHGVVETVKEISAECVLKIKVTPDLFSDGKFLGAKSEKVRAALAQGRKHVLAQLRQKAQGLEANLVSDVAVNNAIKKADNQNLNVVVQATGVAGLTELAHETTMPVANANVY